MTTLSEAAKSGSRTATWLGIAVLVLGVLAICMPFVTGVAITISVGVILLVTAIAQIVFAFQSDSFGSGALRFGFGVLAGLAGLSLVTQPGAGLATITLFLAAWFFVDGVFAIITALQWRPEKGWGLMLFNGIVSIILGVMIYRQFPVSAVWLVGVLVGVRLVLAGWTMIALGSVGRAAARELKEAGA